MCSSSNARAYKPLSRTYFGTDNRHTVIVLIVHVHTAADAKKYICSGGSSGVAHDVASATAKAYAKAVAAASAECKLSGDATAHVDAYSKAVAKANVWLEAYAQAVAAAGDCENCEAFAESWGYIAKDVFLKAVADAKVKVRIPKQTKGNCSTVAGELCAPSSTSAFVEQALQQVACMWILGVSRFTVCIVPTQKSCSRAQKLQRNQPFVQCV